MYLGNLENYQETDRGNEGSMETYKRGGASVANVEVAGCLIGVGATNTV